MAADPRFDFSPEPTPIPGIDRVPTPQPTPTPAPTVSPGGPGVPISEWMPTFGNWLGTLTDIGGSPLPQSPDLPDHPMPVSDGGMVINPSGLPTIEGQSYPDYLAALGDYWDAYDQYGYGGFGYDDQGNIQDWGLPEGNTGGTDISGFGGDMSLGSDLDTADGGQYMWTDAFDQYWNGPDNFNPLGEEDASTEGFYPLFSQENEFGPDNFDPLGGENADTEGFNPFGDQPDSSDPRMTGGDGSGVTMNPDNYTLIEQETFGNPALNSAFNTLYGSGVSDRGALLGAGHAYNAGLAFAMDPAMQAGFGLENPNFNSGPSLTSEGISDSNVGFKVPAAFRPIYGNYYGSADPSHGLSPGQLLAAIRAGGGGAAEKAR